MYICDVLLAVIVVVTRLRLLVFGVRSAGTQETSR